MDFLFKLLNRLRSFWKSLFHKSDVKSEATTESVQEQPVKPESKGSDKIHVISCQVTAINIVPRKKPVNSTTNSTADDTNKKILPVCRQD